MDEGGGGGGREEVKMAGRKRPGRVRRVGRRRAGGGRRDEPPDGPPPLFPGFHSPATSPAPGTPNHLAQPRTSLRPLGQFHVSCPQQPPEPPRSGSMPACQQVTGRLPAHPLPPLRSNRTLPPSLLLYSYSLLLSPHLITSISVQNDVHIPMNNPGKFIKKRYLRIKK